MKRPISLLPLAVAAVFPFISVQACGPFFSEDVFVRKLGADHPTDFIAGKLGVLLPTYNRTDLICRLSLPQRWHPQPGRTESLPPAKTSTEQQARELETEERKRLRQSHLLQRACRPRRPLARRSRPLRASAS